MSQRKQALFAILSILLVQVHAFGRHHSTGLPQLHLKDGDSEATGKSPWSWVERQSCNWFGACELLEGGYNFLRGLKRSANKQSDSQKAPLDTGRARKPSPKDWENDSRVVHEIPQYVLDHAPFVHLYSEEEFWPCDIAEHLRHVTPNLNYTPIQARSQELNLTNLDELNEWNNGRFVYLKSNDNVERRPDWLGGEKNIPDAPDVPEDPDETRSNADNSFLWRHKDSKDSAKSFHYENMPQKYFEATHKSQVTNKPKSEKRLHTDTDQEVQEEIKRRQLAGRSDAPAVLIVVNKGHGIVDAFWFFFYSYNLGNLVFNIRFGNHVGDWEHTLVRFEHGKPRYVFFSEHNFGEAYSFGAVEKIGNRVSKFSGVRFVESF